MASEPETHHTGSLPALRRNEALPPAAREMTAETLLVERLRRGDHLAYEEMVRTHGGRMLSVTRRLLGNEDDARDALQDALLSVFRAIPRFDGNCRLATWLHRIAVNAALMRMRSARRRREALLDDLATGHGDDAADGGQLLDRLRSSAPGAELELLKTEQRRILRECIDRLPPSQRTVIVLRDVEDLSTREVAAALGITDNAVKIRVHRARQVLLQIVRSRFAPAS